MSPELIWLIVAAALALFELIFGAFAAFCPAIGAVIGALVAACGFAIEGQLIGFIGGGAIAFMIIGPMVNKHRRKPSPEEHSNMDALIGRTAQIVTPYEGEGTYGRVKIDGNSWQVVSENLQPLSAGTPVKVTAYDSIILTVVPISE
jgi:membrane protein implicated in regulation of membrane protease activity